MSGMSAQEVSGDSPMWTTPALPSSIIRSLLLLNHFFPDENKLVRVMIEEMLDQLVHCGVDKSLSVKLLTKIIKCK